MYVKYWLTDLQWQSTTSILPNTGEYFQVPLFIIICVRMCVWVYVITSCNELQTWIRMYVMNVLPIGIRTWRFGRRKDDSAGRDARPVLTRIKVAKLHPALQIPVQRLATPAGLSNSYIVHLRKNFWFSIFWILNFEVVYTRGDFKHLAPAHISEQGHVSERLCYDR